MLEQLGNTLAANGFLPHGYCFQWTPGLVWAYVLSDSLIALAYYTIPAALWYFTRKRVDLPFNWIFVMFALFILACGTTHIVAVWNIWQPLYWLDASLKVVTAGVSVVTAIVLWPLIPKALRLPSPAQMIAVNRNLEHEVGERRLAESRANELAAGLEVKVAERVAAAQRLSDQLSVLNEELEEKVRARTAELTRSNEELASSNLELQRFAYLASHDLQSPLRSISGFLQLLQQDYRGKLGAQAEDWIRRAVMNAERMKTLIHDVLTYSRIEARAQPFAAVSLGQAFDEAKAALAGRIGDCAAAVTRDELPVVAGDRAQLVQLMQNLLDNAIKYRGTAVPCVHAAAEHKGGDWTVTVRDNGIGVDTKYHEQVFEMFRRLHTEHAYPGTGIGLAICRRIVEHHGGRIWLTSAPGQGSAVRFTVPRREGEKLGE